MGQTNPARSGWRWTLALSLARAGGLGGHGGRRRRVALARAFGAPTPLARALHARCVAEPDLETRAVLAEAVLATPTPASFCMRARGSSSASPSCASAAP